MVYTKKHPALLIIGIFMVALGALVDFGLMDGVRSEEHTSELQ